MHAERVVQSSSSAADISATAVPGTLSASPVAHGIASVAAVVVRLGKVIEAAAVSVVAAESSASSVVGHALSTAHRAQSHADASGSPTTTERTVPVITSRTSRSEAAHVGPTAHATTVHASPAHSHRAGRAEGTAPNASAPARVEATTTTCSPIAIIATGHGVVVGEVVVAPVASSVGVGAESTHAHVVVVRTTTTTAVVQVAHAATVVVAVVLVEVVIVVGATLPRAVVPSVIWEGTGYIN